MNTTDTPKRIHFVTLGCSKNEVDTETMLAGLPGHYTLTDDASDAEVIVVNTCAFLESAKEQSIDKIIEMAEMRDAEQRDERFQFDQRARAARPASETDALVGAEWCRIEEAQSSTSTAKVHSATNADAAQDDLEDEGRASERLCAHDSALDVDADVDGGTELVWADEMTDLQRPVSAKPAP